MPERPSGTVTFLFTDIEGAPRAVQQLSRGALPEGVAPRDLGEHRLRDLLEP